MSAPSGLAITQDSKTTYHFSSSHKLATNTIGIGIGPFYKMQLLPHVNGGEKEIPLSVYAPSWDVLVEAVVEFGPFENPKESNVSPYFSLPLRLLLFHAFF